jgi:hypothetical protein
MNVVCFKSFMILETGMKLVDFMLMLLFEYC